MHLHSEPDPDRGALRAAGARHPRRRRRVLGGKAVLRVRARQRADLSAWRSARPTVLMAERPTPAAVFKRLVEHRPTIFYGVPTLYAAMLAAPDFPAREALALRRCVSAGEALPADLGRRWRERTGVDILDGIGSTEMLHIFLSNRPGDVRYGTTGKRGAGLRAAHSSTSRDATCADGEIGRAAGAADRRARRTTGTTAPTQPGTFLGRGPAAATSTRSTPTGYYIYCGRSDDMLKVGGIYVSPVRGRGGADRRTRPCSRPRSSATRTRTSWSSPRPSSCCKPGRDCRGRSSPRELQEHVKSRLAPYKYPRWIEFVAELPKTATGKIQRFKLRARVNRPRAADDGSARRCYHRACEQNTIIRRKQP